MGTVVWCETEVYVEGELKMKKIERYLEKARVYNPMMVSAHEAGHMLALRHCFPSLTDKFQYCIDRSRSQCNTDCPAVSRPDEGDCTMKDIERLQVVAVAGRAAELVYLGMKDDAEGLIEEMGRLALENRMLDDDLYKALSVIRMADENGIRFPRLADSAREALKIVGDEKRLGYETKIAFEVFCRLMKK